MDNAKVSCKLILLRRQKSYCEKIAELNLFTWAHLQILLNNAYVFYLF